MFSFSTIYDGTELSQAQTKQIEGAATVNAVREDKKLKGSGRKRLKEESAMLLM